MVSERVFVRGVYFVWVLALDLCMTHYLVFLCLMNEMSVVSIVCDTFFCMFLDQIFGSVFNLVPIF